MVVGVLRPGVAVVQLVQVTNKGVVIVFSYTYISLKRFVYAALALVTFMIAIPAFGQSIDACMSAKQADALEICKALLDNGSRNAKVYFKLASTYHETRRYSDRDKTLNAALKLHPSDPDLLRLSSLTDSATREDEELKKAKEKDIGSVKRGTLKLECLRDDSIQGLAACKQYLSVADDSRVRDRTAYLESIHEQPVTAQDPNVPIPEPGDIAKDETPTPIPTETPPPTPADTATAEARKQFKAQASRIQMSLASLGFDVGAIDGDPGIKTRQALTNFYAAIALPPRTSIDNVTEADLQDATRKMIKAQGLLEQSIRFKGEGKLEDALNILVIAQAESPLLTVPAGYRASLEAAEPEQKEPPPIVVTEAPTPIPEPKTEPDNEPDQNGQFQQLLAQINLSRNQLAKQRQSEKDQLNALRSVVILD